MSFDLRTMSYGMKNCVNLMNYSGCLTMSFDWMTMRIFGSNWMKNSTKMTSFGLTMTRNSCCSMTTNLSSWNCCLKNSANLNCLTMNCLKIDYLKNLKNWS